MLTLSKIGSIPTSLADSQHSNYS